MQAMAIRPTDHHDYRTRPSQGVPAQGLRAAAVSRPRLMQPIGHTSVRLPATRLAPAQARGQIRAVIEGWNIQVDAETAVLLTSELVTNAVIHNAGDTVTLALRCRHGRFRVDVHDSAAALPNAAAGTADLDLDTEDGRGLLLVDTLADEWGFYRTPSGKAVYFALRLQQPAD